MPKQLYTKLSTEPATHTHLTRPLSQYEQPFWFSWQLNPKSTHHTISLAYRIHGPLDNQRLAQAFHCYCLNHHPEVISHICVKQGTGYFDLPPKTHIEIILESANQQQSADDWLHTQTQQPFDLQQGPLYNIKVLAIDADHHILYMGFPHIIADLVSAHLLTNHLSKYYTDVQLAHAVPAYTNHPEPTNSSRPLPPTRLATGSLPIDPSLTATAHTQWHAASIDPALSQAIKHLARAQHTTPFILITTLWGWLLAQWGQQTHIDLDFPSCQRSGQQKHQPGCFIEQKKVALDTQQATLTALLTTNQPAFRQAITSTQGPHFVSSSVIDQTNMHLHALETTPIELLNPSILYDTWLALEINAQVSIRLSTNSNRYSHTLARQWLHHFTDLLRTLTDNPSSPLEQWAKQLPTPHPHHNHDQLQNILHTFKQLHIQRVTETEPGQWHITLDPHSEYTTIPWTSVQATLQRCLPEHWQVHWHHPGLRTDPCPPPLTQNSIELRLLAIWRQVLNQHTIHRHHTFNDCGGQSIHAVQLINQIKQQFSADLPISWLLTHATLAQQAEQLQQHTNLASLPLIQTLQKGHAATLIMVHPGGAGTEVYAPLLTYLENWTVFAIDNPHNSTQPLLHTSLDNMAAHYVKQLGQLPPGPLFLIGWSMGGTIAQSMSQHWPAHTAQGIFMLDTHVIHPKHLHWTHHFLHPHTIHRLIPGNRGLHIKQLSLNDKRRLSQCIRHELKLLKQHHYGHYHVPTVLFKANHRTHLMFKHLPRHFDNGWYNHLEKLHIVPMACHHFEMIEYQAMRIIASHIQRYLLHNSCP